MRLSVIICSAVIMINLGPCAGYRRFSCVLTHDPPDIGDYFASMNTSFIPENRYRTEFKTWSKLERKKACLRVLVDCAPFFNADSDEVDNRVPELGVHHFDRDMIFEKIHETFEIINEKAEYKLPLLDVDVEGITLTEVPAHHCLTVKENTETEVEFAITNGLHRNILIVLAKRSDSARYKIVGVVEPIPSFDKRIFTSEDIENTFLYSDLNRHADAQESDEENEELVLEPHYTSSSERRALLDLSFVDEYSSFIHICDMSKFNQYRACATAYTAWAQFNNEVYKEIEYVRPSAHGCLEKKKIRRTNSYKEYVDYNLLPCLIGENPSLQLFIVNGKYFSHSIFVLQAAYERDGELNDESFSHDDELLVYDFELFLKDAHAVKTYNEADDDASQFNYCVAGVDGFQD